MSSNSGQQLIAELVNEFLDRTQRGEQPSIEKYCRDYPDLAGEFREIFPALVVMNDLQPDDDDRDKHLGAPLDLPEQIGDYRIIDEIGRGGMGVVYEAQQESLGRRVALKVLPVRLRSAGSSQIRFQREASTAAKMHHTNIVPVFEVGQDGDYFFYAMQLIRGQSLDHVIEELEQVKNGSEFEKRNKALGAANSSGLESSESASSILREQSDDSSESNRRLFYRSVARIALQVAEALEFAHARNVIHRDIKPSNLLLDADGIVWVTDFGLAKMEDDDLTRTGDFLGTLRYMSPERFKGVCDSRSDTYALGLTTYELVLQQPAFDSSDRLELVNMIRKADPLRPRSINSRIPRDLETIILKSIDKDPRLRYKSASSMAQDLRRFIDDQPIMARRASVVERAARWMRHNRSLAGALAGIAVLMLLLVGGLVVVNARERNLRTHADNARENAMDATRQAQANELLAGSRGDELSRNLYYSEINAAAQLIWQPGSQKKIAKVVERWKVPAAQLGICGWEWYFLNAAGINDDLQMDVPSGNITAAWSTDGRFIAIGHQRGVYVADSKTGQVAKSFLEDSEPVVAVAWHPAGRGIVSLSHNARIRFLDVATGEELRESLGPFDGHGNQLAWDSTGNQLALSLGSRIYTTKPFDKESPLRQLRGQFVDPHYLSWSPDGTHLAEGTWFDNKLAIFDVKSQEQVGDEIQATIVKWKPRGHDLKGWVHAVQTGRINLFDAETGLRVRSLHGHTSWPRFLQFAGDQGREYLISSGSDRKAVIWDIESEKPLRSFSRHAETISNARISPDGSRAVSASLDSVWSWDTKQSLKLSLNNNAIAPAIPGVREASVKGLAWHPDGNWLATASWDGYARIWNVAERKVEHRFRFLSSTVDWAPDGSKLIVGSNSGIYLIDTRKSPACVRVGEGRDVHWSPDGSHIVAGSESVIKTIELSTAETTVVESRNGWRPEWHPSLPGVLAYVAVKHLHISDNGVLKKLEPHPNEVWDVAWSPDGNLIATASADSLVRVFNVESNQTIFLTGHDNSVNDLDWHPDGSRLATASTDGTVRVWDTTSWKETITLRDLDSGVTSVAWSPEGHRLAAGDRSGRIIIWDAGPGYRR